MGSPRRIAQRGLHFLKGAVFLTCFVNLWNGVVTVKIRIKRVYETPSRMDGFRVLVDRLWPRGITKTDAALGEWCKDVAPSPELRKWFGHDPDRWPEFAQRYTKELKEKKNQVVAMLDRSSKNTVTLLYAAKDPKCNHAIVLKKFIEMHII